MEIRIYDKENIESNFTWKIIAMTNLEMKIQITFENPLIISVSDIHTLTIRIL